MSKSEYYSSESSYAGDYKSYSPGARNTFKSAGWVSSYENSLNQPSADFQINQTHLKNCAAIQEQLYTEIESYKSQNKLLHSENTHLKVKLQESQRESDVLHDKLQKKDKELKKALFDKEIAAQAEDENKKILEEAKRKNEILIKENNELRLVFDQNRQEKKEILKSNKELEFRLDSLQKSMKLKEDTINDLKKSFNHLQKEGGFSTKNLKAQTSKVDLKCLPDQRELSESPERKNLQMSERSEEVFYKTICTEALKILNIDNPKDLNEKIRSLKQVQLKYQKLKKLFDKISDTIVQVSPTGSFSDRPSSHQIWKWLTRLLEEYMKLKQSTSGESFANLCQIMNAGSMEEVIDKVLHLMNHRPRILKNS